MNKLGIHSFVWTGSSVQKDLESAIQISHDLGYKLIEFPRLNPKAFDVTALASLRSSFETNTAACARSFVASFASAVCAPAASL